MKKEKEKSFVCQVQVSSSPYFLVCSKVFEVAHIMRLNFFNLSLVLNANCLNTFVSPEKPRGQPVRLGMASTIPQARQLVNHKHVLVNGRIVDIPSYRCKPQDIITAKDEQKSKALIQNSLDSAPREELPNHLTLHPFQYNGLVNQIIDSQWVGLKINELLVVEYYSRQT
ncbi:hypothetical protein Ahy_A06g027234 [Arachis hypogaea]|uniref:Small ribosomal subunit protein uS4c n=1 Tax=Arachis hypogaea TaxID=3818 RepID=A0A445CN02_ARAHY|nr:hypothetical protein Ahy_A06g027234 [Arachis hypogaea]